MDTFGAIGQRPIGGPQWALFQLSPGAYTLTGKAALLTQVLTPTPGVYTINGNAAKLLGTHLLKGAAGSYAITGRTALLTQVLTATPGVYTINGRPALLTQVLAPTTGVYTINGSAAKLLTARLLKGAAGSYTISGASQGPIINQTNLFANGIGGLGIGNSITVNFTAGAPAGNVVVAFIYSPPLDPSGTVGSSPVTSFADSSNNTWTFAGTQSLGANKGTLYVYWSYLTTAITTSNTFTVTTTPFNTRIDVLVVINGYQVGNAPLAGAGQDFFSSAASVFLTTPTPSSAYDLMVGCAAFLSQQTSGAPTFALDTSDGWSGTESVPNAAAGGIPEFSCVIGTGWLQDITTATKTFQPTAGGPLTYNTPGLAVLGLKFYNNVLNAAAGSYTISGASDALLEAHVLDTSPNVIASFSDRVTTNGTLRVTTDGTTRIVTLFSSYIIDGHDAALLHSPHVLLMPAGVYTINGDPAAPLEAHVLRGASGAYAITGRPAALLQAHKLMAAAGAYAYTGIAEALVLVLPVAVGAYTINGHAAAFIWTHVLGAAAGSYAYTGFAVAPDLTFPVPAGAYTINGQPAAFIWTHVLGASPGSYAYTGFAVAPDLTFPVSAGTYAISGDAAALIEARVLDSEVGTYEMDGADAALYHDRALDADAGAYAIVGDDAEILASGLRILPCAIGPYIIAGQSAKLRGPPTNRTRSGWKFMRMAA